MGRGIRFFVLTYAVSFAVFLPAAALAPQYRGVPLLLGTFTPGFVAIALTWLEDGRPGLTRLFERVVRWRVSWKWYAFAVGFLVAIKIAVAIVYRLGIGSWPRFGIEPWYILAIATVISTPFQAGEEIGWRGYALPQLWRSIGLPAGSIILGILWALWHLPAFFLSSPGNQNYGQSFAVFVCEIAALSVAMAWLFANTNSVLLTMLMHSAVNQTRDIVPSAVQGASNPLALSTSLAAWLTVLLLWAAAAYFIVRMQNAAFLPRPA